MKVVITGKKMDIGESLTTHMEEKVREITEKYSLTPSGISVTMTKEGPMKRCEIDFHLGREVHVHAHGKTDDAWVSFDETLSTLEKRLRKHKKRLVDHHKKRDVEFLKTSVQSYVLDDEKTQTEDTDHPLIIAETKLDIPHMTVGEAVMRMDFSGDAAFVFHNEAQGRLNVVYRREDGNIGWIDPETA